jgi:hypothetical protein
VPDQELKRFLLQRCLLLKDGVSIQFIDHYVTQKNRKPLQSLFSSHFSPTVHLRAAFWHLAFIASWLNSSDRKKTQRRERNLIVLGRGITSQGEYPSKKNQIKTAVWNYASSVFLLMNRLNFLNRKKAPFPQS